MKLAASGLTIAELQTEAWGNAERKGFHDGMTNRRHDTLVRLFYVVTEVVEAGQEIKRHMAGSGEIPEWLRDKISSELADIVIRVGDLAGCLGLNLEQATISKLAENRARPHGYGTPRVGTGSGGL